MGWVALCGLASRDYGKSKKSLNPWRKRESRDAEKRNRSRGFKEVSGQRTTIASGVQGDLLKERAFMRENLL